MKIVIIGSGNVAAHLARAFKQNAIAVEQLFGRNFHDLKEISDELLIPFSTTALVPADLYLLCVSDRAVQDISKLITAENCLVAHTSGSLPIDILKGNYRKANFYPMQTFSKSRALSYEEIPFFIEAENEHDSKLLSELARKISPAVVNSTHEKRKFMHLTAVFACNFVNHLFARAKEISDAQQIPFEYFLPLIKETTAKIEKLDPKLAQTGPAVRNDQRVLQLHEEIITDEQHLKIYRTLNESIKKMYEL